jgi:DNA-binding HxlR family transcriptional regulator
MNYEPYGCPIRYWLAIFGDKWSLLIVRDIMLKERQNYGQFQDAGEGISTSVLANKLNHLENHGIISKSNDENHGKKYVYRLTEKGKELANIMINIIDWSEKFDEKTLVEKEFIGSLREDPIALRKKLVET